MATPTILDSIPLTAVFDYGSSNAPTSGSVSYTVPGGGTNTLLLVLIAENGQIGTFTLTQNSVALSATTRIAGTVNQAFYDYAFLAAPTTGTLAYSFTGGGANPRFMMWVFTLQDAAQTTPVDTSAVVNTASGTTLTNMITTSVGNDFLVSMGYPNAGTFLSFGAGETLVLTPPASESHLNGAWKAAASSAGSESMTINNTGTANIDLAVLAIKYQAPTGGATVVTSNLPTMMTG